MTEYNIRLNPNCASAVHTGLKFKSGDKGITFKIAVDELDTTGTTAKIVFLRANGTSVESDISGTDGVYTYKTLGNEFAVPGKTVADVKIYASGNRESTASFLFDVCGDTMDGLGAGAGGYSDRLEQLVKEAEEAKKEAENVSEELENLLIVYQNKFGEVGVLNPRGTYNSSTTYEAFDLVYYGGVSWLCLQNCTGIAPAEGAYWQLFASADGGNAAKLGGKAASEYALGTDLEDYGLTNKFSGTWKRGLYNTNGTWDTSSTNNWITADDILVNSGNVLNAKISLIVTYVRVIYFNGSTYDSQILFTNTNTIKNLVIPSNITKIAICLGDSKGMSDATHLGVYINNAIDEVKADLANYLPLNCSKSLTGEMKFENSGGLGVLGSGNDLIRLATAYSSADITNRRELRLYNASQRATTDRTLQLLDVVNGKTTWLDILHSGNVGSYALPIGGGTLHKSGQSTPLDIKGLDTYSLIRFLNAKDEEMGRLGFEGADNPVFYTPKAGSKTLHHDGNSAKVVQATTAPSDTSAVWVDTANNKVKAYKDGAWTALA